MSKTLTVTKINYAHGYADVSYCEVDDATGSRDGFADDRLCFDPLDSEEGQRADVDAQLRGIASDRGCDY